MLGASALLRVLSVLRSRLGGGRGSRETGSRSELDDEPLPITCKRCGHQWYTRSRRVYVTCPNCMTKVRNPHALAYRQPSG